MICILTSPRVKIFNFPINKKKPSDQSDNAHAAADGFSERGEVELHEHRDQSERGHSALCLHHQVPLRGPHGLSVG